MELAKRGPIDIDLLTPFSPIHAVWKRLGGTCPPSKYPPVRHSLPNENTLVTSQSQRATFNLKLVPLQQACAPLLPIQGY